MAKLDFNLWGYSFQEGLKRLQASFELASATLAAEVTRARAELADYEARVAVDPSEWEGEVEPDGSVLWHQAQVLELNIEKAAEGLMVLRKAMVIAAYHQWERSARRWGSVDPRASHKVMSAATSAKGYPVHPRLEAVTALANTLKHDGGINGPTLLALWPDVFTPLFSPRAPPHITDWFDAVTLADDQVLEAFAIIAASGPIATLYSPAT